MSGLFFDMMITPTINDIELFSDFVKEFKDPIDWTNMPSLDYCKSLNPEGASMKHEKTKYWFAFYENIDADLLLVEASSIAAAHSQADIQMPNWHMCWQDDDWCVINEDDMYEDISGYGSAYEVARFEGKFEKLPIKFDFDELLKYENIEIYNELGVDLKREALNNTQQAGKTMEIGSKLKGSARNMGDAASDGLKLAVVNQANEVGYNKVKELLGNHLGANKELLEDPKIKAAIKFLLPMVLHPLATTFEDKLPHTEKIQSYCEASMTDNMSRHGSAVISTLVELFQEMASAESVFGAATKTRIDMNAVELMDVKSLRKYAKKVRVSVPDDAVKAEVVAALETAAENNEAVARAMSF